ncbi:unnamed protein product (macronuclear) [Paramecium tetraurelia]|uniref:Transmembrane protein n=1 Tax=Paramecium tetraurelia TaxID=5888 RepID=A0DJ11_PARTE|nr:uncharacterized protein GSPATT00017385001 [Paramecium tetraurelia]CAK83028.1 unnamed protein product [Paramecium tetraurelia]|eukprot:XP_001450425.1 hypothetical protein (macronuclear) [Paramecium tetraurelia strain d4-2]
MNKLAIYSSFIAVTGLGLYLVNKNSKKEEKIIEKVLLVKILKDLQKQYYSIWERMIETGRQLCHVKNNKSNENQTESLKDLIESKFQKVIEKIEQSVYVKHQVSQDEVDYNCKIIYKDDEQINALLNYINLGFEQALKLELNLPANIELPEFIKEELILKTQCQILISSASMFNKIIQQYASQNGGVKVTKHSNAFQQVLAELKQHSKKQEILDQNGFDASDEPSSKLFYDAIKVYSENRSFKQKLVKLNEIYDVIMSEILENGQLLEIEIENRLKC